MILVLRFKLINMYLAAFQVEAHTEIKGAKEVVENQSSCQFAKQIPKVKGFGINSSLGSAEDIW